MKNDAGYAVVPGVFSDLECAELLTTLATCPRSGHAGTRHLLSHPAVAATVAECAGDARLLYLASQFLGGVPTPFRATLFEKGEQANWLIAWHQDLVLPLAARFDAAGWGPWSNKGSVLCAQAPAWALERVVALRVHLDDSSSDNGPLRVIPQSHRDGVLSDAEVLARAVAGPEVECTVPCGGVIAMRPLIIHASSKSSSDRPRRVLHIEYADGLVLAPGIELAIA